MLYVSQSMPLVLSFLYTSKGSTLSDIAYSQNSGAIKLWQIDHFRVLARKMLVNLQ